MDKNITLDTLDVVESLHKSEFYFLMTGKEVSYAINSTEVPVDPKKHIIREDNMDIVMKAVNKFEKRYSDVGYYTGPVERIREFYKQNNFEEFHQEILELLVNIRSD